MSTETPAGVCYRHPNRESWVLCQRCGRTICPACQTQAAVGVQCPECMREGRDAQRGGRSAPVSLLRRFVPRGSAPVVTYTLMGLCVVVYLLQWVTGQWLTDAWLLDPSSIESQPWRLLTSAFLHSPTFIFHLLFNLYALFIFGPALEHFLGRGRFVALYLVGALGGGVAEVLVYQANVVTGGELGRITNGFLAAGFSLGASGAIFALMGALLVLRKPMGLNMTQILVVVVLNLVLGFVVRGIAWEAHLGGLIAGAAVAYVYLKTRRPELRMRQILLVGAVAVALVLICVACVVSQPGFYR